MELTILDRVNGVTYDEVPYGSAFLWRLDSGYEYDVFIKPMADIQMNSTTIHAISLCEGRTVRFERPEEDKFIPVTIEQVQVKRV
jgi:hypothetical protein